MNVTQHVPSRAVFLLTTSEGRDKLFKVAQYLLKLAIWLLLREDVFPEGTAISRSYWIGRLRSNFVTVRNGRSLFRIGRWLVSVMDVAALVSDAPAAARATRALLTVRCVCSVVRSAYSDVVYLAEKELFGIAKTAVSPTHRRQLGRVAAIAWMLHTCIDLYLTARRTLQAGWVPHRRTPACGCLPAQQVVDDVEFPPLDLDRGCPPSRTVGFLHAANPGEMTARCGVCGSCGAIGSCHATQGPSTALMTLPRMLHRVFDVAAVVARHANFREQMLLLVKAACDVWRAMWCAHATVSDDGLQTFRDGHVTMCGLVSAVIGLHRVWLAGARN